MTDIREIAERVKADYANGLSSDTSALALAVHVLEAGADLAEAWRKVALAERTRCAEAVIASGNPYRDLDQNRNIALTNAAAKVATLPAPEIEARK